ncbi:MAG: hypothetical protein ACOCRK_11655, partial [bacterium]
MVEIIIGDGKQKEKPQKELDIINGGYKNNIEEQKLESNSQLKDVLENLDRDVVEGDYLTSIDFNTRLTSSEVGDIVALQMMDVLKVGGEECSLLARTIKRHKVSIGGEGRKEKVQVAQGE